MVVTGFFCTVPVLLKGGISAKGVCLNMTTHTIRTIEKNHYYLDHKLAVLLSF